ncbi:transglutaminase-like domain-containing protein [Persicobacter diffluens]|uniref:Protein SirB1 N-terminal domain-containing protein n=1 Tax=Persicobacter diffluens TaxID=981 RepID=A0AAN4VW82_9BACT|nr:hypothetical protein PEDI_06440 [Persicobacter diffluens]
MIKTREFKALVSLLDDEDQMISSHINDRILSLGVNALPLLEKAWEEYTWNPEMQLKISELMHHLQYQKVVEGLENWRDGDQKDLMEALYWMACYSYPELQREELDNMLDAIIRKVRQGFNPDGHPVKQVKHINQVFFDELGFGPNSRNFHNPANSMVNQVLLTKRGNPISLCSVYYLVAKKLGMPITGVNLPNLFVLMYPHETMPFYINVFNKGLIFSREDLKEYVRHLQLKMEPVFFEPCSHWDIVVRSLRNLHYSFEHLGATDRAKDIQALIDIFSK